MKKKCLLFGRVLLAFLVFEVVSFVLPELWALFLSGKEMEKELMLQLYQAGSSIIVILAAFPAYVLVMRCFGPLARFSFQEKIMLTRAQIVRCFALAAVPVFLLYGAACLLSIVQKQPITALIGSLSVADAVRELIIGCCLMPLVEELMFRGVTLHILKEGGDVFAIIVSTLFFALGHSNPVNVLLGLCTGILFAHMTLKYKGIRAAYACHVFVNLLGNLILPLLLTLQNTP